MYRPDRWDNPHIEGYAIYEAGADAMLEALRKNGTHEPEINLGGKQISTAEGHCFPYRPAGTYIFIPDEES